MNQQRPWDGVDLIHCPNFPSCNHDMGIDVDWQASKIRRIRSENGGCTPKARL